MKRDGDEKVAPSRTSRYALFGLSPMPLHPEVDRIPAGFRPKVTGSMHCDVVGEQTNTTPSAGGEQTNSKS